MNPKRIMLIAGEASGDMLAAELVKALHLNSPSPLEFFGAGGPKMAEARVDLAVDMTAHSIIGLIEALKNYSEFKKLFDRLLRLAIKRKPDVIVCVDFSGFNRRFAHAVRKAIHSSPSANDWNPKIVQYVSPQVWASRPARAEKMARDIDLLLCIFPFEKDWYAKRVPNLRVEFVGHPVVDRYTNADLRFPPEPTDDSSIVNPKSQILLLPGSRVGELKRHWPVMLKAAKKISAEHQVDFKMVLPNKELVSELIEPLSHERRIRLRLSGKTTDMIPTATSLGKKLLNNFEIQIGDLAEALSTASLAIASTGTVTMECAYFGVPTVAIYKTSWSTYQIGKRIIQVKFLAMPNLLANEMIFPEFIQDNATPENISSAALDLLSNSPCRELIKSKLQKIMESLGGPGASERAAKAILAL